MNNQCSKLYVGLALALLLLFITIGSAGAVIYEITAEETTIVMPDGAEVPAWGYRLSGDPVGTATVPGPVIDIPAGHGSLIVILTNNLPEKTSLHILGQTLIRRGSPRYKNGRVLSFNKHVKPGATKRYRWNNFRPGTYMLQSATNPAKQVQMGLFAAVVKDFAPNVAYDGVPYDEDRVLVFHEVDPDIHAAIANGTYGFGDRDAGFIPSSVYRHPRYYLVNGKAYPQTSLAAVTPGNSVLLRFVNAGLDTHVPQILNKYVTLVAQDGYRRNYDQQVSGFELNAAGTMDALLQVTTADDGGRFPIYDARVKHLSNYGNGPGGMLVHLHVGAPAR